VFEFDFAEFPRPPHSLVARGAILVYEVLAERSRGSVPPPFALVERRGETRLIVQALRVLKTEGREGVP